MIERETHHLAQAIEMLAAELRAAREERKRVLATKHDLLQMEARLSKLIISGNGPKPPRVSFHWGIGQAVNKNQDNPMPLEIKITNEQKIKVTLTPKTDAGKPAQLDGVPTWEVISGDSTVVAEPDGLSATLVSSDTPGDTQILVKADADIGAGIEEISDVIKLSVVGASAKNLGLIAGTPETK